jgi:hypothetical protein
MRRLLRSILLSPVLWATAKFSSRPKRPLVFKALDKLYASIIEKPGDRGLVIPFNKDAARFIIFSDQHKGGKDGSDDFIMAEPNYLAALEYYYQKGFTLISLGDNEELWENTLGKVKKANEASYVLERKFIPGERFVKIFGNHDLFWDNDPFAGLQLKDIYKEKIKVYEGVVLSVHDGTRGIHIFCTHGHQGDTQSDGNWFSKFFVARIWAPLQAFLLINPNTPAYDKGKKSLHNDIMYQWSSQQKNMLLVTGHTHQPVFASLTHLERLYKGFQQAQHEKDTGKILSIQEEIRKRERDFATVTLDYMNMKPSYFNSGCCCFIDGDITGLEIDEGCLRLIKWKLQDEAPARQILEEISLDDLLKQL